MTAAAQSTAPGVAGEHHTLAGAVGGLGAALLIAVCFAVAIPALYVVKASLGINFFPGHAPFLHALLYPLVAG